MRKRGSVDAASFSSQLCVLLAHDLAALIKTTGLASAVRQQESAAVGALNQTGNGELPVAAASLITSLTANFSLGDCHGDTS